MAQFGFNENGDVQIFAEYTTKGVNTMQDIFPKGKKTTKLLKLKDKKPLRDVYDVGNSAEVVRRVFYDFLILLLTEITSGGMLIFPGKTNANISLKQLPDSAIKSFSKNGWPLPINIVKARYKIPAFHFDFGPRSSRKDRFIRVPERILAMAYNNAEEGKIKYVNFRKMINHDL